MLRDVRLGPVPAEGDSIVYLTEPVLDAESARGRWCTSGDLATLDLVQGTRPRRPRDVVRRGRAGIAPERGSEKDGSRRPSRGSTRSSPTCRRYGSSRAGATRASSGPPPQAAGSGSRPCTPIGPASRRSPRCSPICSPDEHPRSWPSSRSAAGCSSETSMVNPSISCPAASGSRRSGRSSRSTAATAPLTDALLRGGCRDRRPDVLSRHIEALAADERPAPGWTSRERLRAAVPRLQELCPPVARGLRSPRRSCTATSTAGTSSGPTVGFVLFDWSDACVADPFVDVLMFVTKLPDDAELRTSFRDRYLETWPDLTHRRRSRTPSWPSPWPRCITRSRTEISTTRSSPYDRALFVGSTAAMDRARPRLPDRRELDPALAVWTTPPSQA